MSSEFNIDLNDIFGTGKDGRVLKEDVIAYMESQAQVRSLVQNHKTLKYKADPSGTSIFLMWAVLTDHLFLTI